MKKIAIDYSMVTEIFQTSHKWTLTKKSNFFCVIWTIRNCAKPLWQMRTFILFNVKKGSLLHGHAASK